MEAQEGSLKINEALNNTLNDFLKFPLAEAIAHPCILSSPPMPLITFLSDVPTRV